MTTKGKETTDAPTRSRRFSAGAPNRQCRRTCGGDSPGVLGKGEVSVGVTESGGTQVMGSGMGSSWHRKRNNPGPNGKGVVLTVHLPKSKFAIVFKIIL